MTTSDRSHGLFEKAGSFAIGCNWWASHAGTAMWRDWRPDVIEADFARLTSINMETVRLFPLWPDFQPIVQHRGNCGDPQEIRHGDTPLCNASGVDPEMLERLAWTCQAAHRHGLKLIIGLITGWMSGRMHAPEAIAHFDAVTDPRSIIWQVRLVRAIVARLAAEPAVAGWDLGNECNCMGRPANREAAAIWTAQISDAIRAIDRTRPVISGMHGLVSDTGSPWVIRDQGEHCDILTTHPYPLFVPHCAQDGLDDPRTTHHPTAETRLYSDLSGKPACAEEIGSLGPSMGGPSETASFTRMNLFSLWANDCRSMLWWCAFDQSHLEHTPYEWHAMERELGLFDSAFRPRPLVAAFAELAEMRARLPDGILPPPQHDAVCILTRGQDQWSVAWSAWILAKQAGFDLRFAWAGDPLPACQRYILPSVSSGFGIHRRQWLEVIARVDAGAELLLTHNGGPLSPLTDVIGADIALRRERRSADEAVMNSGHRLPMSHGIEIQLRPFAGTEVLARNRDGAAVAVRHRRGHGAVTYWAIPIEHQLTSSRGSCDDQAPPFHLVYRDWFDPLSAGRILARDNAPWLALTEHALGANQRLAIGINHGKTAAIAHIRLAVGWHPVDAWRGAMPAAGIWTVPAQDIAVIQLAKDE